MGFVFEDRDGNECFFKDDYLERLAWLGTGGEWCDPIEAMKTMGHKLVGADDAGLEWLNENGFDQWVTVDHPVLPPPKTIETGMVADKPPVPKVTPECLSAN